MANVIKLKYGSGVPGNGQLVTGEIGLDLTNKVIYSCDGNNKIVEMGRNMGEGGTIGWDQIDPDTIPPELEIIINGEIPEYVSLDALVAQVKANEDAIDALESWEAIAKGEIIKLQADVSGNTTAIETNASGIKALNTSQGEQDIKIQANTDGVADLDGRVTSNKAEIDDLKTLVEGELTGLTLGGQYDAANNLVRNPTAEGIEAGLRPGEALPATAGTKGIYVVVTVEGPLQGTGIAPIDGGRADGEMAFKGDWLVSDGVHGWVLFSFHTDSTLWGTIGGDITAQADLQAQFATKLGVDDDIVGGNYTT